MRYFFQTSYNGAQYHGWQRQNNAPSVQETIETRMSTLLQEDISITGSGRTDKGVHCKKQFFHTDIKKPVEPDELIYKLNSFLPGSIAIHAAYKVPDDAHARFDAVRRTYDYFITLQKDPLFSDTSLYVYGPLRTRLMGQAAQTIIGTHDFTSFSKVKTDVNTFICTVYQASWKKRGQMLIFNISANRFLRGMVRALVGTMLEVGKGNMTPNEFREVLLARDRKRAGSAVAPQGLVLTDVQYPEGLLINQQ